MTCLGTRTQTAVFPGITSPRSPRLLTAVVTCLGQDGVDLVGPDASQGSDGIQDLDLQLSNLSGPVSQIAIQAPGGFEWATAARSHRRGTGGVLSSRRPPVRAIFISTPRSRATCRHPVGSLPLGGSTGSLIQLANGMTLTVTIDYQGQTNPDVVAGHRLQPGLRD